ncbi:MAG: OmpA family protein [Paludibacteraceae bacterium]|nr:OmpA family protein [Paludibacteraceae bacterium]
MRKICFIASLLLIATSLSAKQLYPDSVQAASQAEPNISYGWNFEFAGGVGLGCYQYKSGTKFAPGYEHHVKNMPGLSFNAAIGINYYFLPWMGLGTGAQLNEYTNKAVINEPWRLTTTDSYGDEYTITATPHDLKEVQNILMLEIPFALKFRVRPATSIWGFTGTAGVKLGLPMFTGAQLYDGGSFENSVYYPKFDLTIHDVPGVVETVSIPGKRPPAVPLRTLNYAAYLEAGMLVRVHQRIEVTVSAYFNYYINDVMKTHGTNELGFGSDRSTGKYPMPYAADYNGVLWTQEVETLHPWSVGLRVGVQFNAGRTNAQRAYDNAQIQSRMLGMTPDTVSAVASTMPHATSPIAEKPESTMTLRPDSAMQDSLSADSVQEQMPDSIEEQIAESRREAIAQIEQIARDYGIDLCRDICLPATATVRDTIHDTVYLATDDATIVNRQPASLLPAPTTSIQTQAPAPVKIYNPVAAELDEVLSSAVIYFDLDKADPILQPKDILERIAEVLRRHPNQQIHVNGHACKLGKPAYNKALALRRANAVADKLRALGVQDRQMLIASLGSNVPFRYNGQHQLSKDRRVEIVPIDQVPEGVSQQSTSTQTNRVSPTKTTEQAPKKKQTFEVVQAGSSLAQMARHHYGVTDYWVFIYEANREKLHDPSDLKIGTFLLIPDLSVRLRGMSKEEARSEARRLKALYDR